MPIPKIVITAALTLANMALTATKKIEGPRLDDLKFTGGDYGTPLAMVWGIRRMQVPIFWAEDLTEVKRRRKTKGGKYNDYSYYGTWAVALAGHEIQAARRIWFDTHLVYDLSGAGPVTPFDFGSDTSLDDHVAIYLGTETQESDPRMQATVEAEFGAGSCPAYRGTAYICFKDIPLDKLGNRIPQVSVEILGAASSSWPTEEIDTTEGGDQLFFSPDYTVLYSGGYTGMAIVDTAARTPISQFSGSFAGIGRRFATYGDNGDFIALAGGTDKPYLYDPYGGSSGPIVNVAMRDLTSVIDGDGDPHWITKARDTTTWYFDGVAQATGLFSPHAFADLDGDVWVVLRPDSTSVEFHNLSNPQTFTVTGLSSGSVDGAGVHYRDDTHDQFVFDFAGVIYAVSPADGSILYSHATSHATPAYCDIRPGATTMWAGFREISLADLTVVRSLTPNSTWGVSGFSLTTETTYDPINHALVAFGTTGPRWFYLDRVAPSTVTLETICNDVAGWCGIEAYDFSDLDQAVTGWSATRGPASAMLEPLLDAYDSDIRPHEFTIEGLKRTGVASGATLATEYFTGQPRYSVKVRQAAELPRALLIDFADIDADQQPNTARADRPLDATGARGEQKIDLTTLALDPDEARQLGNRYFRRLWNERKEVSLSLTAKELKLEPGDVRTLELDGEEMAARCVRVTAQATDVLATEWRFDAPTLATLDGSSGAVFDGRNVQTVSVAVLSRGFVLDVPLISDADDASVPQVYPLAAPYASGTWPGAIVYQAVDGEYSEELASIPSSSSATWGTVAESFAYTNPNLWDRGTSLTVTLQNGELTGCTEAGANADPTLNLAAIGTDGRWEIVQFTTATLTSGTTYTVSGFKRGRRGTEWAAELHAAGDTFLLLDNADPAAMGLSEVGTAVSFKAITAGRTTGFAFGYDYTGATLKPYAPCQLRAVKDSGTGDWTLTWTRRTRVGGAWTSGTTIPLSETSEEYEVEIMNGASVVRTITGLTSATTTYTAAQQTTDFGSGQSTLTFRVYQISADVDRGFVASATA